MADKKSDVEYTRPNTLVEQEEWRKADREGKAPEAPSEGRSFAVEGNDLSGYVGVDPEYQTYANDTEAPALNKDEQALADEAKELEKSNQSPSNVGGTAATTTSDSEDKDDKKAASKTAKE